VGIGVVFGALILGVARNPSLRGQLFSYAILGFAFAEATGLFALMMASIIFYIVIRQFYIPNFSFLLFICNFLPNFSFILFIYLNFLPNFTYIKNPEGDKHEYQEEEGVSDSDESDDDLDPEDYDDDEDYEEDFGNGGEDDVWTIEWWLTLLF